MNSMTVSTQLNLKPNHNNFLIEEILRKIVSKINTANTQNHTTFYRLQEKATNLIRSENVDILNYWSIEILDLLGNKEPSEEQISAMEHILKINDLDRMLKTL